MLRPPFGAIAVSSPDWSPRRRGRAASRGRSRRLATALRPLHLLDQTFVRELLEGRDRLFLAATARLAHGVEVEGPADNRGGVEQLYPRLADRSQAPVQEVSHSARQRPGFVTSGQRALRDRREVLSNEERQPLRLLVQALSQALRAPDDRPDQLLYGGSVQAPQPEHRRRAALRYEPPQAVRDLLAAPGEHDAQPSPGSEAPHQVSQQVERRGVGPVHVVDKQHAW